MSAAFTQFLQLRHCCAACIAHSCFYASCSHMLDVVLLHAAIQRVNALQLLWLLLLHWSPVVCLCLGTWQGSCTRCSQQPNMRQRYA